MIAKVLEVVENYFYNIIAGVVILLAGFGLGILAKKFLQRVLREIELNRIMSRVGVTYDLEKISSQILSYVIYLVFIVLFLEQLQITSVVLYLVVGAILMLLIFTFLVGLKDVIPNFIAWIFLQKKSHLIKEGYHININEISGIVERIGYLETEIKTEKGDVLYVPNSLFLKSKFRLRK